ncbi:MAG TPA: hypothetical protein VGU20_24100 [Stellaceae bacterium]|nr:hypothetical protein [Stellaceae bacterium]
MTDHDANHSTSKSLRTCIFCGEDDPTCLEFHNISGLQITLCRRCRRRLAERASIPPDPIWTPLDDLESVAGALLAEADFLSTLAQSRWVLAHALIDRVRREAPDSDET